MVADGRPSSPNLAALARQAGRGDRDAFEALVAATSPAVFARALRLVGNEHDAADVVQETYLRAYRSIDRFRGDAAVTTWLYRIASNCASTNRVKRARDGHLRLDDEMPIVEMSRERDPQANLDAHADREALKWAITALPAGLRSVVVLRDVYGLSHSAIAEELGISRAAAKVRLHRGRRKLRDLLFPPSPPTRAGVGDGATIVALTRGDEDRAAVV